MKKNSKTDWSFMNMKDTNKQVKFTVLYWVKFIFMYLSTVVISYGAGIIWKLDTNQLISIMVMACIGNAFIIFTYFQEKVQGMLLYDNDLYEMRFLTVYFSCYLVAMAFPVLPVTSWFFPVIAVTLMLFSNRYIGFVGSTLLLIQTVLLVGESSQIFALFFVCNMVVLFAFRFLNDQFDIIRPIVISVVVQITMMTAMIVMFSSEPMSFSLFAIPIINLFLTTVLLLVILKQFSTLVVHKFHERYMTINDQTFELMVQLKEKSLKTYLVAIHTAYLVERIAQKLEFNIPLTKAGSYYGEIEVLFQDDVEQSPFEVQLTKYEFPPEVIELILELQNKDKFHSKEATIITMCNELVCLIGKAHDEKKEQGQDEITLDYATLIEDYIQNNYDTGRYDHCDLSIYEYKEIKKILISEGLYYDFLY